MKQSISLWLLATLFLATGAQAQQPAKLPHIAYVTADTIATSIRAKAFRDGLRELGYVEGKNIIVEWRSVEGKLERAGALAEEVVALKVDAIVASGPSMTPPLRKATTTIPIVMAQDPDPIGSGFVASLAQPGGNITGLTSVAPEITGKRLEILKEIIPKLTRVSVMGTSSTPGHAQLIKEIERVAPVLGLKQRYHDILDEKHIEPAFRTAAKERAQANLVLQSFFMFRNRQKLAELSVKHHLPAIYQTSEWVEAGGLMAYGTYLPDLYRRAAIYVDKILKGRKPTDLPVEQPMKFEFIVNLKAAKQIGLTIPPNVLARADRVIK